MEMLSEQPERRPPVPGFAQLPGHVWRGLSSGGRWAAGVGVALTLGAAIAFALAAVPRMRADRDAARATADRAAAADRAAVVADLDRQARPKRAVGAGTASRAGASTAEEVRVRRRLLTGLEAAVLADARGRVERGELPRPVASVRCFEFPRRLGVPPPERQLGRRTMGFECVAVEARVRRSERSTGSLIGQPFRARLDFATGRSTWCRIVQRPGELSIQQALVRVPSACSR